MVIDFFFNSNYPSLQLGQSTGERRSALGDEHNFAGGVPVPERRLIIQVNRDGPDRREDAETDAGTEMYIC